MTRFRALNGPAIALDNFFEWKKTTTGKQPYPRSPWPNRRLMGMAGLWENLALAGGRKNRSFTINHHHSERIVGRTA